jgi:purine-binding chemotaxis protein CheW
MTNWEELRAKLRETADILNQSEHTALDTLEPRTRQLARTVDGAEAAQDATRALTFAVGTERYAWLVRSVSAIARIGRVTPVPSAPLYYRGVTSLRGQVLSVLDLRAYLGLPPLDAQTEFMIVIDGAGLEIGVLATDVFDVMNVRLNALTPASSAGLDAELVIGVTVDGMTILDAEALLRRERSRVDAENETR